ncbi:MAG: AmmeMemoRadiSam system radical SAM enzyme [Bilifractor sp.]
MAIVCNTCFHHCHLAEGQAGFCGVRRCTDGQIVCDSYGYLTSVALDPVEKKPLAMFHPGSYVLSVGSYGCNLHCPFCQNYTISYKRDRRGAEYVAPDRLVEMADDLHRRNPAVIGIAYTYNEMLTSWEYVRDTAKLAHAQELYNVLVTNGTAELPVLEEILPWIDAMNVDLKGFTEDFYRNYLGGDLHQTLAFIQHAATSCHMEVTTLLIPGKNDTEKEIRSIAAWLASLKSEDPIVYHLSRYFPRYKTDLPATDVAEVYHLAEVAREILPYVFTGNC